MSRRRLPPTRPTATGVLTAVLLALALASPARAEAALDSDPWAVCAAATDAAEAMRPDLPAHLLGALAKVESGRWHAASKARLAWPWTVMAEGRGRYLPSKAAAIAEVRALKARGVSNIDVGCMQVNLHWHGKAFDSLEQAFDPAYNVAYAAAFLLDLRASENSWTKAIGVYHSRTPKFSGPYRSKVFRHWRAEKKAAVAARIAERRSGGPGAPTDG
jgi:soluble lytic murein transglycosylase-like protein